MRKAGICVAIILFIFSVLFTSSFVFSQGSDEPQKDGFSGKGAFYTDTYNGYKVFIPEEFTLSSKGATTSWMGARYKGNGLGMSVNFTPMTDVSSQAMYDINFKSYKKNRDFTDVVPVKVKYGTKTVPGFRVKEVNHNSGNPDLKEPSDIHRWHLFAYANGGAYQVSVSGPFQGFQENAFQKQYDVVMKTFEIIPMKTK